MCKPRGSLPGLKKMKLKKNVERKNTNIDSKIKFASLQSNNRYLQKWESYIMKY